MWSSASRTPAFVEQIEQRGDLAAVVIAVAMIVAFGVTPRRFA